jgi:chemosensory pili system protein ChpA (sensor histidine kinase/response regulator)
MPGAPEPILDMSEIVNLYKEDARRMIAEMRAALLHWDDVVSGGPARQALRRLSHQLRGSGRTYGFQQVTQLCKAVENIVVRLEKGRLKADERVRAAVQKRVDRLATVFTG